jgi:hypothetical protein
MAKAVFLKHKHFVAKGHRDALLAQLASPELAVTSGLFKGTRFVAEALGEDRIAIYPLAKNNGKNGLLQAQLTLQSGVSGTQVKLSTGIPLLLIVAFAVGFLTHMGVVLWLGTQEGTGQTMTTIAPILGASIAVMIAVMLWSYKGLGKQLEQLVAERLQLKADSSPVLP